LSIRSARGVRNGRLWQEKDNFSCRKSFQARSPLKNIFFIEEHRLAKTTEDMQLSYLGSVHGGNPEGIRAQVRVALQGRDARKLRDVPEQVGGAVAQVLLEAEAEAQPRKPLVVHRSLA
jgi:hypothetical protein